MPVDNHKFELNASLLDADPRWTAWDLTSEVGLSTKLCSPILYDILEYRKIAARWISHEISECATVTLLRNCTELPETVPNGR